MKTYTFILSVIIILAFSCTNKNGGSKKVLAQSDSTFYAGPIIDMHLHGYTSSEYYGGDPHPSNGTKSPKTFNEFQDQLISSMDKHHIRYAVLSASLEALDEWTALDPRFIPAHQDQEDGLLEIGKFESLIKEGQIKVFGEIMAVYKGITLADSIYQPYLSICEKYDIPVAVHTGTAQPRLAYTCCPDYRIPIGNPLLIEEVLIRHPKLRIYLMHAGGEYYEQAIIMMHQYPQLYVDLGAVLWIEDISKYWAEEFLRIAKQGGFIDRVMFGSDPMVWPDAISQSIDFLNELDFLTAEDKRKIFHDNAARFLNLSKEEMEQHGDK